jgi:N-acetylmuramoyl-L-alanine amidase
MNTSKYGRVISLITLLTITISSFGQTQKFKVALDAGHGDHDFGTTWHGYIEKKIALSVVLKVGKILEKNPNIEVIYTRKTDVFIGLIERANIANKADANIFVSIHCNANKNNEACGTETYVMGLNKNASNLEAAKKENEVISLEKDYKQKYEGFDPNSPESMVGIVMMNEEYLDNSIALAGKIQNSFIDELGKKSRGVKQAPFMVLHKAYMPRVLIEMGFLSNPAEGAKLDSEEGQTEIAQSIANAITSYKKEYFGSGDADIIEKPSQKMVVETETTAIDTPSKPKEVLKTQVTKKANPTVDVKPISVAVGTVFKVQLSASSKKLDLTPNNFNGLKNISMASDNNFYKYMYGDTSSYDVAMNLLQEAKSKGYSSAFLIAFRDGKKISVQDALKQ